MDVRELSSSLPEDTEWETSVGERNDTGCPAG